MWTVVLVVLLASLLSTPADATLTATGGSIHVDAIFYEPGGTMLGENWSLFGGSGFSCCVFGPPHTMLFHVATLTVSGVTTTTVCCDNNSIFTFIQPELPTCSAIDCPPFSAPFTMTGHVNLGEGFDVTGGGLVYSGGSYPPIGYFVQYEFQPSAVAVPESLSLLEVLLIGVGLVGLVTCSPRTWRITEFGS